MNQNLEIWKIKYKPILNPLVEPTEDGFDEDCKIHWHTIEENDLIKDHIGESQVWTVVEGKRDSVILKSGFHREKRKYHYITQIPYTENIEIVLEEGYPEITKDDLENLNYIIGKCRGEFGEGKEIDSGLKIIEYIERTGVSSVH